MKDTLYLFSAFGLAWIVLFAYIFSITRRQKSLESRLANMRSFLEKIRAQLDAR